MSYPYWTYSHAWFESLSSVSSEVYTPIHSNQWDWSSGGWFTVSFISQYIGFTQAHCTASTSLNYSGGSVNDILNLNC